MNEADFKRMIVKDFTTQGHYAKRIEHQYAVGVPDLLVKHKDFPAALIEVKYFRTETRSNTFPNKATPKQREELEKFYRANGISMVWNFFKLPASGSYILRASLGIDPEAIRKDDCPSFIKERGNVWNFSKFLKISVGAYYG